MAAIHAVRHEIEHRLLWNVILPSRRNHAIFKIRFIIGKNNLGIWNQQTLLFVLVMQPGQEILYQVDPRLTLVIGAHHEPRRDGIMGAGQHFVARQTVLLPVFDRLSVYLADLPLFERVVAARLEALFLLLLAGCPGNT